MLGTVSDIVFGYFDILPRHASIYSNTPWCDDISNKELWEYKS